MRSPFRPGKTRLSLALLCGASGALAGCATESVSEVVFNSPTSVSIAAFPGEDLEGACTYDLLLQEPNIPQAGTLVIFERGDSSQLYADLSLRATAKALHFAMLWAHQCNSRSHADLQSDAAAGPARTLQMAMTQLASSTNHPELASGGMILFGFSAAGVLSATLANIIPNRILGTILYAPADAYVGLAGMPVTAASAAIPSLILANADDTMAGTWVGITYFQQGRMQNAAWAYAVQHATTHCCTLSTVPIIEPWITAIGSAQTHGMTTTAATQSAYPQMVWGAFTCTDDGVFAGPKADCSFTQASISSTTTGQAAWLPNQVVANAWLAWTANPSTN